MAQRHSHDVEQAQQVPPRLGMLAFPTAVSAAAMAPLLLTQLPAHAPEGQY